MAEHGILMNGPMALAAFEGRKWQTRRPVRLRHNWIAKGIMHADLCLSGFWNAGRDDGSNHWQYGDELIAPNMQPGDVVWIREPARVVGHSISYWNTNVAIKYVADGTTVDIRFPDRLCDEHGAPPRYVYYCQGLPNGIFREAARTVRKLTRVWIEQVQDISEEDAIAEGMSARLLADITKKLASRTIVEPHAVQPPRRNESLFLDYMPEWKGVIAKRCFWTVWDSIYGAKFPLGGQPVGYRGGMGEDRTVTTQYAIRKETRDGRRSNEDQETERQRLDPR